MPRRHAYLALVLISCVGCASESGKHLGAPYGMGLHFTDTKRQTQTVDLSGVESITIQCYCLSHRVVRGQRAGFVTLNIRGTYAISGFHGDPKDAGAGPIPGNALHFRETRVAGALRLESPEWRYLHHSLIVDEVIVATSLPVHFEHFTYEQLEKRGAGQ